MRPPGDALHCIGTSGLPVHIDRSDRLLAAAGLMKVRRTIVSDAVCTALPLNSGLCSADARRLLAAGRVPCSNYLAWLELRPDECSTCQLVGFRTPCLLPCSPLRAAHEAGKCEGLMGGTLSQRQQWSVALGIDFQGVNFPRSHFEFKKASACCDKSTQ